MHGPQLTLTQVTLEAENKDSGFSVSLRLETRIGLTMLRKVLLRCIKFCLPLKTKYLPATQNHQATMLQGFELLSKTATGYKGI